MSDKYSQGLELGQRQRLRLSQQHLRFVKMLEFNTPELEEAVEKELADNPALTVADADEVPGQLPAEPQSDSTPYYLRYSRNASPDDAFREFIPVDHGESLLDHLSAQISERSDNPEVIEAARYIAGYVDSNGYIRRDLSRILDDLEFGQNVVIPGNVAREALELVRSLDPAGVGARDLRDCLILQLERRSQSVTRDDALAILRDYFSEFSMKHYHKLMSGLLLSRQRVLDAVAMIQQLNPKPGASFSSPQEEMANFIVPDFIVENNDGQFVISLNSRLPELAIDISFKEAVGNLKRNRKIRRDNKESVYIFNRYSDARDFINILRNRQQTMIDVMTAIVSIQHDYFVTEDVARMKPMMIKDIAAITGFDLSTISRATANKYVSTSWGVFPLRHFFSDTIGEDSDGLTNRRAEAEIEALVASEDKRHPLSDEKICRILNDKGFDISRRTVAKYRDRKGIPVARLRKSI